MKTSRAEMGVLQLFFLMHAPDFSALKINGRLFNFYEKFNVVGIIPLIMTKVQ